MAKLISLGLGLNEDESKIRLDIFTDTVKETIALIVLLNSLDGVDNGYDFFYQLNKSIKVDLD